MTVDAEHTSSLPKGFLVGIADDIDVRLIAARVHDDDGPISKLVGEGNHAMEVVVVVAS